MEKGTQRSAHIEPDTKVFNSLVGNDLANSPKVSCPQSSLHVTMWAKAQVRIAVCVYMCAQGPACASPAGFVNEGV